MLLPSSLSSVVNYSQSQRVGKIMIVTSGTENNKSYSCEDVDNSDDSSHD